MKSNLLKYGVPGAFYALLLVFLVLYLRSIDFNQLRQVEFSWFYVGIASALALISRYWGAIIWLVILSGLGARNLTSQLRTLFYVYAKAWLGRYIPGTAPWILGKIYFASQQGISKNKLAVSSLLEAGLQIVVVMVISFLLLIFDDRTNVIDPVYRTGMVVLIAIGVLCLVPAVFNFGITSVYRLLKKKQMATEHLATAPVITKGALMYAIGAVLNGLSLFFVAKALYPELGYDNMLYVMGVTNLAGAIGMLAIFAPSGIGVREGVQLVLLSLIMPTEIALVITVFSRLWSVIIDGLFFMFATTTKNY